MRALYTVLMSLLMAFTLQAQLSVGDTIPDFTARDAQGEAWRLKDHLGKNTLVVYFYPVAFTGGCTKQACAYRDKKNDLDAADVQVIGISGDQPENLKYFAAAHGLNFTLLSDAEGKVAKLFGVPTGEGGILDQEIDGKTVELKRGVTTARWTFIIDKTGKVVYKNEKVDPTADPEEILRFLKKN